VAAATLDEDAHEVYIADGYLNRRVLVYDWDTGKFKRGWGANGKPLAEIDNDTGKFVAKIGHHGHQGGMFHFVHVAFMDSKGNLYTGEVDSGKRVQKFMPQ